MKTRAHITNPEKASTAWCLRISLSRCVPPESAPVYSSFELLAAFTQLEAPTIGPWLSHPLGHSDFCSRSPVTPGRSWKPLVTCGSQASSLLFFPSIAFPCGRLWKPWEAYYNRKLVGCPGRCIISLSVLWLVIINSEIGRAHV